MFHGSERDHKPAVRGFCEGWLQTGASKYALRKSWDAMGRRRDPEFRRVYAYVLGCAQWFRHRVAARPSAGDPSFGDFLGGRNCGLVCHCDEHEPEGGIKNVFRVASLVAGENLDRGKEAVKPTVSDSRNSAAASLSHS